MDVTEQRLNVTDSSTPFEDDSDLSAVFETSGPATSGPETPGSASPSSERWAPPKAPRPISDEEYKPMTVEQVQKALRRSRASIYRYANTETGDLAPPIDPNRLNPEPRKRKEDPLLFAPSEVERFAKYVLGIKDITLEVQESPDYANQQLMKDILEELRAIRRLLERRDNGTSS